MDLKGYLYYIFVQPTSKSYCTFLMLTHRTYICPLHYALLPNYPPLKTCGCW